MFVQQCEKERKKTSIKGRNKDSSGKRGKQWKREKEKLWETGARKWIKNQYGARGATQQEERDKVEPSRRGTNKQREVSEGL